MEQPKTRRPWRRTTIMLVMYQNEIEQQSISLGQWHVHKPVAPNKKTRLFDLINPGLCISHSSGILAINRLTPACAVRLLRALQAVPPSPSTRKAWIDITNNNLTPNARQKAWLKQVSKIIKANVGPIGDDFLRRGLKP